MVHPNSDVSILLVVEEDINRFILERMASIICAKFDVVLGIDDALKRLEENNYQYVIIDMCQVNNAGIFYTRKIRAHSKIKISSIPVIGLTTQYSKWKAYADIAGMNIILSKAIGVKKISQKIKSYIEAG